MRKMYKKISSVTVLLLLLVVMTAFAACKAAPPSDTASVAKIYSFSGQVTVFKAGDKESFSAVEGMLLTKGDRITTGKDSTVILALGEEQELRVAEGTDLTINELLAAKDAGQNTQIGLASGCLWAEVKEKLDPDERFEIATPTAVMGVRGTKFSVAHSDGASKLAVFEGKVAAVKSVEIIRPDGSKTTQEIVKVLEQNQQTEIEESVTKEEDIQILPISLDALDPFVQEIVREQGLDLPDVIDDEDPVVNENPIIDENPVTYDNAVVEDDSTDDEGEEKPDPAIGFSADLPAGYPLDMVPILPGARIVMGVKEGSDYAVSLVLEKDYQEVLQYYRAVMQDKEGFTQTEIDGAFFLTGVQSGYYIALTGEPQHVDGKDVMTLVIAMAIIEG